MHAIEQILKDACIDLKDLFVKPEDQNMVREAMQSVIKHTANLTTTHIADVKEGLRNLITFSKDITIRFNKETTDKPDIELKNIYHTTPIVQGMDKRNSHKPILHNVILSILGLPMQDHHEQLKRLDNIHSTVELVYFMINFYIDYFNARNQHLATYTTSISSDIQDQFNQLLPEILLAITNIVKDPSYFNKVNTNILEYIESEIITTRSITSLLYADNKLLQRIVDIHQIWYSLLKGDINKTFNNITSGYLAIANSGLDDLLKIWPCSKGKETYGITKLFCELKANIEEHAATHQRNPSLRL